MKASKSSKTDDHSFPTTGRRSKTLLPVFIRISPVTGDTHWPGCCGTRDGVHMIVILGGGPAGRIASIRLASAGKEVSLIERGGVSAGIGGQCLHFGCMPVCALNDVARFLGMAKRYEELGLTGPAPQPDFPRVLREMQAVQAKIAGILDCETRNSGVEIIYGKVGRLDRKTVWLDEERITPDAVIVATGSRSNIPPVAGITLPGVFTPRTLALMPRLPEHIVILGGAVMAAEYAYIFSRFGSRVTVLSRSTFLKTVNPLLRAEAVRELSGVTILEHADLRAISGNGCVGGVVVKTGNAVQEIPCDAVFVAAGLVPRSDMISGVDKGPSGEVIVNEYMETNVPGVYAGGDVTGPPYLTPVARHQGIVAADNILGERHAFDITVIPQAIYLENELAFALDGSGTAKPLSIPGPAGPDTFWSVPSSRTGLAEILVEADGSISGIVSASPAGGLIAAYMAFLMKHHFPVHDFEEFIEVHPTTDGVYGLAKYASELLRKKSGS
jgi:dihydrolipoamide dehydrogenase